MKMCRIEVEPRNQPKVIEIIRNKNQRIGISNVTDSDIRISIEEEEPDSVYKSLMEEISRSVHN